MSASRPNSPPQQPDQRSSGGEINWKLWLGLLALLVLVIFVAQNSQRVEVDFLFTTTETPLIFALLITSALGAVFGWLFPRVRRGSRND